MTARLALLLAAGAVAALLAPISARAAAPPAAASQPAPAASQPAPAKADEDGPPRFSLPTENDRAAWRRPGFRLALGLSYGVFVGLDGAPQGQLVGPQVRIGVRLDGSWSLQATLQYLYAAQAGATGLSGLRYAGTLEPTWHATPRLGIALGVGFGGLVERSTQRPNPDPQPSTLDSSYTFPNAHHPLPRCAGVGVVGLLRGEYLIVMGPRSSMGVAAELAGQWTGCVDPTGREEPDTAKAIVRRQWWPHLGFSLAWVVAWR